MSEQLKELGIFGKLWNVPLGGYMGVRGGEERGSSLDQSLNCLQFCARFLLFVPPDHSPPCPPCSWKDISEVLCPPASGWIHPVESLGRRLEGGRRVRSAFLFHWLPPREVILGRLLFPIKIVGQLNVSFQDQVASASLYLSGSRIGKPQVAVLSLVIFPIPSLL